MSRLTTYQTHCLIKAAIPDASTVYERENKGQMTFEEYMHEDVEHVELEQSNFQSSFRFLNGL